jgi:colicin import membrane protein
VSTEPINLKSGMAPGSRSYAGTELDPRSMGFAVAVSTLAHIIFFAALVLTPDLRSHKKIPLSVITVNMVALPSAGSPNETEATAGVTSQNETPKPLPQKVPTPVPAPAKKKQMPPKAKKAVSLAPKKSTPKPKKSLKKKTFKPDKVVKRAINRLEKQVETSRPTPLDDALSKLRKSVKNQTPKKPAEPAKSTQGSGRQPGLPGGSGPVGGRAMEILDIYRVNIAIQIQQNWAFSEQLAGRGKDLQASLVFKVYPNGEIKDVFFTDRSGNRYLDESAHKAIVKSNPVNPHPTGVIAPYVQVGLRFTPEGIN